MPDFYSVKLDVIGFGQKPHFWNQGTSCSNTLYLIFQEEQGPYLRRVKMNRVSRVYPLSFIVNFRTGPGPVLSLFGLKDRRTGPFKKARTVDTL